MRKPLLIFIVLLALMPVAIAAPKRGGTLVLGFSGDPEGFNPVFLEDPNEIIQCIFSPLYRTDPEMDLAPDLLAQLPAQKGLTYSYELRRGVRFSDGHELDSTDVKFTWQIMANLQLTAVRMGWEEIKSVDIPVVTYKGSDGKTYTTYDKYRFSVTLKRDYPRYESLWADRPILPRHILEAEMKENGGQLDPAGRFSRYPVGSGPFMLKEFKAGNYVMLVRNPFYFKEGRPYLDRIVWKIVPDAQTMLEQLRAGEIHICTELKDLAAAVRIPGVRVVRHPLPIYNHIELNMGDKNDPSKPHPILAEKRIRQALEFAFPRELVVEKVFDGLAYPAYSFLPPTSWAYCQDMAQPRFDLERANKLLDEAGWRDGDGDGIRDKEGLDLRLTIKTHLGQKARERIVEMCREYWRQIGVDLLVENADFATIGRLQWERRFDLLLVAWQSPDRDPDDARPLFHSGQIPSASHNTQGRNFVGFRHPEMDRLLDGGAATMIREERRLIYRRVQEILLDEAPYIFVNFYANAVAYREGLAGFRPNSGTATNLWNADEWYWAW